MTKTHRCPLSQLWRDIHEGRLRYGEHVYLTSWVNEGVERLLHNVSVVEISACAQAARILSESDWLNYLKSLRLDPADALAFMWREEGKALTEVAVTPELQRLAEADRAQNGDAWQELAGRKR